jgi:ubiquinone biosynthesis protein UbiJ
MHAAAALAKRLLERESWARQRLAVHAGRRVAVSCGPAAAAFRIEDGGLVAAVPASATGPSDTPDLRLSIAPWLLPGLLADPSRWDTVVRSEGDSALAGTLRELSHTGPFWIEQLLATWLGPVVGQRAADAGRQMLAFPEQAAGRLAGHVATYLRDETGAFVRRDEGLRFANESARLASRLRALDARIEALALNRA